MCVFVLGTCRSSESRSSSLVRCPPTPERQRACSAFPSESLASSRSGPGRQMEQRVERSALPLGVPIVPPPLGHIPPPPPCQPPPVTCLPSLPVSSPYHFYTTTPSESYGDGILPTPPAAIPLYTPTWAAPNLHTYPVMVRKPVVESTVAAVTSQTEHTVVEKCVPEASNKETSDRKRKDHGHRQFKDEKNEETASEPVKVDNTKRAKRTGDPITVQLKPQKSKLSNKLVDTVAAEFAGSDSEDEEIPKEARNRMRNIGKDTPTSSGPNSFSKTTKGFSDTVSALRKEKDWS